MRGAWGKPYGTVARVNIGQVLLSIRTKESNAAVVVEALRRARYKFPGRQKIVVSKKWGFTNVDKEDYLKLKADKRVVQYVFPGPYLLMSISHCVSQGWFVCAICSPAWQPRAKSQSSASCLSVNFPLGCINISLISESDARLCVRL